MSLKQLGETFLPMVAGVDDIFKETPVSAQSIVGDMSKVMDSAGLIRDLHPPVN